jgi:hypothetical protein
MRKDGKRKLALKSVAAPPRGKIDFEAIRASFGKYAIADHNVQRQQLVVLLERGDKLDVTDRLIVPLVDDKNFASVSSLPRTG